MGFACSLQSFYFLPEWSGGSKELRTTGLDAKSYSCFQLWKGAHHVLSRQCLHQVLRNPEAKPWAGLLRGYPSTVPPHAVWLPTCCPDTKKGMFRDNSPLLFILFQVVGKGYHLWCFFLCIQVMLMQKNVLTVLDIVITPLSSLDTLLSIQILKLVRTVPSCHFCPVHWRAFRDQLVGPASNAWSRWPLTSVLFRH